MTKGHKYPFPGYMSRNPYPRFPYLARYPRQQYSARVFCSASPRENQPRSLILAPVAGHNRAGGAAGIEWRLKASMWGATAVCCRMAAVLSLVPECTHTRDSLARHSGFLNIGNDAIAVHGMRSACGVRVRGARVTRRSGNCLVGK